MVVLLVKVVGVTFLPQQCSTKEESPLQHHTNNQTISLPFSSYLHELFTDTKLFISSIVKRGWTHMDYQLKEFFM